MYSAILYKEQVWNDKEQEKRGGQKKTAQLACNQACLEEKREKREVAASCCVHGSHCSFFM